MAEWGRKEYAKAWPSRTPVWTWTAFFLSLLFFAGLLTLEYEQSWTAAERLSLSDYLKSGARGKASATSRFGLSSVDIVNVPSTLFENLCHSCRILKSSIPAAIDPAKYLSC
jgi:hypothetical protein